MLMGVYIDDNKLVIITEPKTIPIDSPIKINKSLYYDIKFIVGRIESSAEYAEYTIKDEIRQILFTYGHEHKKELSY